MRLRTLSVATILIAGLANGQGVVMQRNLSLGLARTIAEAALAESKTLDLRLEAFNAFNHAQFYGPNSVDGNISSATFGHVVSAAAPRLLQVAVKLVF